MINYLTSLAKKYEVKHNLNEICIIGRSNVGKSSFVNMITNSNIANVSSKPGKTRMINLFNVDNKFIIADLPGYGFSISGKSMQKKWEDLINSYFQNNKSLKFCFLLLDIRHLPCKKDIQMIDYLNYFKIKYYIILNKADKLNESEKIKNLIKFSKYLNINIDDLIVTSTQNKLNKDIIMEKLIKKFL